MLTAKEKIIAFLITIAIVAIINGVYECYDTKEYTISYTEAILNVQKNIDENIVEIKDKAITRGSVLLLAEMENDTMNLYHLKRGYLTLKYRIEFVWEDVKRIDNIIDTIYVENRFEKFRCKIDKYNRIIINPATFAANIDMIELLNRWLSPILIIVKVVMYVMERRKEKVEYNSL